jgi:hypothetical protein
MDVFVAGKELQWVPGVFEGHQQRIVVGHDAIQGAVRRDQIGPGDLVGINAVDGRLIRLRQTLGPQQRVHDADRLVVMLEDHVSRKTGVLAAEIESIGRVMRLFRRTGRGSPAGGGGVAAAGTVGKFVHRPNVNRTVAEAIFRGVIPAAVLGVAAARHRAVIADVREGVGAAGRIVGQHGIGAERSLTTEGQRAERLGRYTAIEFVIEDLTGARAVDGFRIAAPGQAIVGEVGGRGVGELAGIRIDAGRCVEHHGPAVQELFLASDAHTGLR